MLGLVLVLGHDYGAMIMVTLQLPSLSFLVVNYMYPANPSFGHQYYIPKIQTSELSNHNHIPTFKNCHCITTILYSPSQLTKLLSVATPTMQSDVLQPAATSVGLPWSCSGPPDRLCQCTIPCGPTHRHR